MGRICVIIIGVLLSLRGQAQFTQIPTGTSSPLTELHKANGIVFISGTEGYLAKCDGNCDELIDLTAPGFAGYIRDDLNVLDTNNLFISSHVEFPHHGYTFK